MNAALITGASSGIGEVFARKLAARGRNVLLVARSEGKLITLCNELGRSNSITSSIRRARPQPAGIAARLFEEAEKRGCLLTWLVNNAGFGSFGDFSKADLARELNMIDLNVTALVELTYLFLKPMRERTQGEIINVASTAAFQAVAYMATYAATKSVRAFFFRSVVGRESRIRSQSHGAVPGVTETNFFEAARGENRPRGLRKRRKKWSTQRCGVLLAARATLFRGGPIGPLMEAERLAPRSLVNAHGRPHECAVVTTNSSSSSEYKLKLAAFNQQPKGWTLN